MAPMIAREMAADPKANHYTKVLTITLVFVIIAFAGVTSRLVSKRMKHTSIAIDDYLLIFAFILSAAESALIAWATQHAGFGRHYSSLTKAEIISFEKVFYSLTLMQPSLLAATKISVLILLRRIFITPAFRRTTLVLMIIVTAWWIAVFFGDAFICFPVNSVWNPDVPGHCGSEYVFNVAVPIPWIVTDFAILLVPLPMVRNLHIATRQKVALAGLFLVGGLTCIVSCVRYRYAFFALADPTWDSVDLAIWNVIESNVTILCGSLIASKPVIMFLLPDKLFSRMSSYFKRSLSTSSASKMTQRQTVIPDKDPFGSQSYLQMRGSMELSRLPPNSGPSQGTKTSQEATHEISTPS